LRIFQGIFPAEKRKKPKLNTQQMEAGATHTPSTSTPPSNTHTPPPMEEKKEEEKEKSSTFECNICLETAEQPVITMCGHLFW
jgi:hypothetical protein